MNIKSEFTKFATITGMVLSMLTVPVLAAESSGSHDHGHGVTELRLNNGSKWAIDPPLSLAMGNIRNAMNQEIDAIHADQLAAEKYVALSKKINGEVTYMVENCELEPEADEQLHLIINDLAEGSTMMEDKARAQDGAVRVIGAIENYATYFDDPNFKSMKH